MAKDNEQASRPSGRWATTPSRELIRTRYFPDVTLQTHEGKKVRLYDDLVKGRCVTINFMYTRCQGICSPVTTNLLRVQELLASRVGKDIFMYSFTLKPREDTPDVLADYVKARKIGPGWTFVTGAAADMELVRRRLGFVDLDPQRDADTTNHTGMVRYGNEPQQLWAAFPGMSKADAIVTQIQWVAPARGQPRPNEARELGPSGQEGRGPGSAKRGFGGIR